MSDSS